MAILSNIEDGLDFLRAESADADGTLATFIWHNVSVPCVMSILVRGSFVEMGGVTVQADAKLFVKKSDLLNERTVDMTAITIDSTITIDYAGQSPVPGMKPKVGVRFYKVKAVGSSKAHYELALADQYSGR